MQEKRVKTFKAHAVQISNSNFYYKKLNVDFINDSMPTKITLMPEQGLVELAWANLWLGPNPSLIPAVNNLFFGGRYTLVLGVGVTSPSLKLFVTQKKNTT